MNKEELLKEAKRRYPIGTWIKSIYTDAGKERQLLPYDEGAIELTWHVDSDGVRSTDGITTDSKYGGGCSNPLVWTEKGGWCPITKFAPKSFKIGDKVRIIASSLYELTKGEYVGNNSGYTKGDIIYTITGFAQNSSTPLLGNWAYLNEKKSGQGISINLLELVEEASIIEPVKQEEVMAKYKFKVGDRVECTLEYRLVPKGTTGTILKIDEGTLPIGVAWDIYIEGHSLHGKCEDGYGYYVHEENIKLISESKPTDLNVFPKDSYVVLLSSCDGNNCWEHYIPEGFCYQLREDSNTFNFRIKQNTKGRADGWGDSPHNKLKLRAATPTEIIVYKALDKPYKVGATEDETKQVLLDEVTKRYPIGTKYVGIDLGGVDYYETVISNRVPKWMSAGIDIGVGYVYHFESNKWANYKEEVQDIDTTVSSETLCPYPHGTKISCYINGTFIDDARISITSKYVFICQNIMEGDSIGLEDRFSYSYSWMVVHRDNSSYDTWKKGCEYNKISDVKVLPEIIIGGRLEYIPSVGTWNRTLITGEKLPTNAVTQLKPKVWRFKTKEEFIGEGLWNVDGYPQGWNNQGMMNKYLGASIPSKYHSYCESNKPFSNEDGWYFDITNYTDKPSPFEGLILGEGWCVTKIGNFDITLEETPIIKIEEEEQIELKKFIVNI